MGSQTWGEQKEKTSLTPFSAIFRAIFHVTPFSHAVSNGMGVQFRRNAHVCSKTTIRIGWKADGFAAPPQRAA
jgi:hypothetical protein